MTPLESRENRANFIISIFVIAVIDFEVLLSAVFAQFADSIDPDLYSTPFPIIIFSQTLLCVVIKVV
jgi:hypothetical protein